MIAEFLAAGTAHPGDIEYRPRPILALALGVLRSRWARDRHPR